LKLELPSKEKLVSEFASLEKQLKLLDSPLVFCHNDLLLGNIVHNEAKKSIAFIDYEYAAYNHQAFDIGNHFNEFAGKDIIYWSAL
jgi:ethanolamine kinase